MKKIMTTLVMAGVALTTTAQAAGTAVGSISSVNNAFVSRDGRLLSATPNMRLIAGDRVITRAGGSAKVAMNGNCNVAVGSSAMLAVANGGCGDAAKPVSFDQGRAGYAGASSSAIGGTGLIFLVLGVAAAAAGVVAASSGGNSTSP